MTRIRKEPNRYWSKDDKLRLINEVLGGKSSEEVAKQMNAKYKRYLNDEVVR